MFSGCSTRVVLLINIRCWKDLPGTKTFTLFDSSSVTKKKELVTSKHGANQGILKGSITVLLTSFLTCLESALRQLTIFLQNRLIQTSQTGGQRYSDTSPLVFPGLLLKPSERCSTQVSFGFAHKH